MSRRLNDLSPGMRLLAVEFLACLTEAGFPVCIVTTSRTQAEQADAVRRGVSWTMKSKHLTGDAIDVCPYETYLLHGPDKLQWDDGDAVWTEIGKIGEGVGLKWGVMKHGIRVDLGHFERIFE